MEGVAWITVCQFDRWVEDGFVLDWIIDNYTNRPTDENGTISSFTMDLVEPNVALMHDRIDFDVSDLSLEKDCMKELGIRVDIQHKSYLIELETIVDHIKKKRFQVLCPVDDVTQQRIDKMQARGWV
ncbi:unnamed protein product [Rotaria sordida]|uniref:Uncharacterized protein n=1 Tax=Rotaria sordida TaxID=392033 RepID=A0A814LCY4_9BILA|nr:unnamed protein product [Rotaria sordida]CAF3868629.1 unnamed protein product [Rotaria sordida]